MSISATPREIVEQLDQHIVGQAEAKRAVANALRNRWRRLQLPKELQDEVTPKNILLIGPTGVGKTEIARRLAKLAKAPFLKVEATKFTEVGYVGKDVESIIRDLADVAMVILQAEAAEKCSDIAERKTEEKLLTLLTKQGYKHDKEGLALTDEEMLDKFRRGDFDDQEIDVELSMSANVEFMMPPGMEEIGQQLKSMFTNVASDQKRSKKMKVSLARKKMEEEETAKSIDEEALRTQVVEMVSQKGIVFIDEMDKVVRAESVSGVDVSREGVQRDLLPLIEGCGVSTRYGIVHTDHILFIASGAFHLSKPADLIPEMQGRLPVRVTMDDLKSEDFKRILVEPKASLIKQYQALLATEGIDLVFEEAAIDRLADLAWKINETVENIGARRLHTIMEKLLEGLSFNASERGDTKKPKTVSISPAGQDNPDIDWQKLEELAGHDDLSRSIL